MIGVDKYENAVYNEIKVRDTKTLEGVIYMNVSSYNAMLPANISKVIRSKGLKNNAVAKKAGFSSQQFSDMLNGRKIIKPCDIIAISFALGIDVDDLFLPVRDSA